MSKKLNHSLAIGIFLIGIFSANISQAQYTNAYWDVNGTNTGEGGTGTFSSSGVLWTTNSVNATAATGGPINGGLFALITGPAGTVTNNNSGGYNINFGGTAGNVKQGGNYQAASVNFLSSGYNWWVDANAARTITTTNGINLNGNALILSNGTTGVNSLTFEGPTSSTGSGINSSTAGATLTLKNNAAFTAGSSSFGVYVSGGGTVSTNIAMNVEIGAGSKILLGSQSSGGATFNSTIVNNSASGVALNILNSTNGTVALNGVISGANGLILDNTGTGKIALTAANTYAGGTTLNSTGTGEIIYSNAASFGTGTITANGSGTTNYIRSAVNNLDLTNAQVISSGNTLRMAGNTTSWTLTNSGTISGAGALQYSSSGTLYLTGTDNSFGGGVTLGSSGTLYFNKFGASGLNSSLGTNGTITVGVANQGAANGTLRWTGSVDETSDKVINLNSSTNGVTIYANGATNATLRLNGAIVSVAAGNKSFTFQGAATNTLILNGLINQNGGINSVVIGGSSSGTVVLGNANNSFSGAITITNATTGQYTTLQAANIGNANANSALGQNGTINIGSGSATAYTILKYTGTGETSDKVINLAGTTGGATLDQSGTGSLKFTSAMTATGVGAKAITLQGSTAGTGEIAGGIPNQGANTISLEKKGSGAWALSGNNSYSGLTTVTAGTLTLSGNNSLASGGVTLTAGTLNVNSANALGSGTLTLTTGSTINNTSGSAVINAGNNAISYGATVYFGDINSTSANDLDLGTGTVTMASNGHIASFAGTNTTLKMGTLDSTRVNTSGTGISVTATNSGSATGNTLSFAGFKLGSAVTNAVIDTINGNANVTFRGAIINGANFSNGITIANTATTTFAGDNTYTGLTRMNAAAGTLTLSGNNSTASGGVTLTAGTLNINNNNALGSGALTLSAGTINNTSGAAVVNAANNAVTLASGLNFGTSASTSSNNLDLGTGTVTVSADRTLTLLGTGTTLKMGTLESTATSGGKDFTFNGTGNTMFFRGFNISTGTSTAVTNNLVGSANLTVSGPIANGNLLANGVNIKGTGTTTFSGANTYTGGTEVSSGATLVYGASNVTADTGAVVISGIMNIGTFNDTVASVKVSDGGSLTGSSGVLSAGSFSMYGPNSVSAILGGGSATLLKMTQSTVTLLSGANTYGGLTTVSGGTLKLGSSTALGSTAGATTVGTGGFLDLNGQTGVAETLNYTGTGGLLNSAVGTTAIVSGAVDIGVGMTVETAGAITLSGQLTGSVTKNLTKSGAGTLKVTAANSTFAGTNTVSAGTLLVDTGANVSTSTSIVNGGLLNVNGTAGGVTVNLGGSLGGTGTVGAVTLKTGSYLKPGNSPGLLTASASSSWAAGSYYNWEINDAKGTAGTNWDVFYVSGSSEALDLSALSSSAQMNLVLESLSIANYSTTTSYEWVIAKAAIFTGITEGTQDLTSLFNINSDAFNGGTVGNLPNGGFQVVASGIDSNNLRTLSLMAIPEPSTGSMLAFGLGGLVLTRLLRRKQI
jgi:autotransporter-associated beta strand protein